MQTTDYSPDELEALRTYEAASLEEREKLLKTSKYKKLSKKVRDELGNTPGVEVLAAALIHRLPAENQEAIQALQFVIYGLEQILSRPEVQKSAEVKKAMHAVHESVAALTILGTTAEDIWEAFAFPHVSVKAKKAAGKLRGQKHELAHALFERWADDPSLYRNLSDFARDCIRSEFIETDVTAKSWAKMWGRHLPKGHPLIPKLGKLQE